MAAEDIEGGGDVKDLPHVFTVSVAVVHSAPSMEVLAGVATLRSRDDAAGQAARLVADAISEHVPDGRMCSLVVSCNDLGPYEGDEDEGGEEPA